MAVELRLMGSVGVSTIEETVGLVLGEPTEREFEDGVVHVFIRGLWISIGTTNGTRETPDGDVAYDSFAVFRVDKFDRHAGLEHALDCVAALVALDESDCALAYMSDNVVLVRKAGRLRLFRHSSKRDFWDVHRGDRFDEAAVVQLPPRGRA